MQGRIGNLTDNQAAFELSSHIFNLLTQDKKNVNEQWCLIDEIPEKYLTNKKLILKEINFTLFGFHLHDINFRDCIFYDCKFSSQLFTNCDFNESILNETPFIECQMDKTTGNRLPKEVIHQFVDDHKEKPSEYNIKIIDEQITQDNMRTIAREWIGKVKSLDKVCDDLHPDLLLPKLNNYALSLYLFDQCKSLNSQYESIVIDAIDGFYIFNIGDDEKYYRGWKLHLSVNKYQVKQAYNSIASVLLNNHDIFNYKVIDTSISEYRRGPRLTNGGQFTIYLYQDGIKPLASDNKLKMILQEMSQKLQQANIMPGEIPESDKRTLFPYFSLRNDGDGIYQYYPAQYSGTNYNPYHLPPIFNGLLSEPVKRFDVVNHFSLFNKNSKLQYIRALSATLIALINDMLKPEHVYSAIRIADLADKSGLYDSNVYLQLVRFAALSTNFVKEGTKDCDLIMLFMLLEKLDTLIDAVNEPEKYGYVVINLLEKLNAYDLPFQILINNNYTVPETVMPCAIRSHLLNDQPYKLLNDIKQLYELIPSEIKKTKCILENEQDPTEYRKTLVNKLDEKNETMTILDADRLAMLVHYNNEASMLIHSGVTIELIARTPLEILLGVLSKYNEINETCSLDNISMTDFLNLGYNGIMMTLAHPQHSANARELFGIWKSAANQKQARQDISKFVITQLDNTVSDNTFRKIN